MSVADDDPVRFTLVGCGKAKREGNGQYTAANLYTSNYSMLKREYAERMSDFWNILSAKHGLLAPLDKVEPYDVTMSDYPLDDESVPFQTIDEWAEDVLDSIEDLVYFRSRTSNPMIGETAIDQIVMLAGRPYLEPLRDGLAEIAAEYDVEIWYPFDETSGIGEQMGWLKEHTDEDAPVSDTYASIFHEDGE